MNTSQVFNDPITTEAKDMHGFINAMDSSALLKSSPTKRARTSRFAYSFLPMEESSVSAEQQEISKLRDELEQCMREKKKAKAAAAEAYATTVATKKTFKNVQSVRRGTQGSS